MTFEFDSDAFEREVMAQAAEVIKARASELTDALDRLRETHAGQPIDEIKKALIAIFEQVGGSISDPELTEYATSIQANRRIEVKWDGAFEE